MTEYDTRIPVTEEGRDIARKAKRDDETWDDYIKRCADNPPEDTTDATPTDPEAIAAEFRRAFPYEDIDEMQDTLGIIADRTATIERELEDRPR